MPAWYIRREQKKPGQNSPPPQDLQHYLQKSMIKYDLATPPRSRKSDDWLITYTDMVTLLITLFVVMVAHATFEKQETGLLPLIFENPEQLNTDLGDQENVSRGDVIYLGDFPNAEKTEQAEKLRASVKEAGLSESVDVEVVSDAIEVRISEQVLFSTGAADLFAQGQDFLSGMLPTFQSSDFEIIVEGHTDNVPIKTAQYPSNWELSAARALSVVHYLERQGIQPQRLKAIAYGQTRPLSSNNTQEGRRKNRRVQIILR